MKTEINKHIKCMSLIGIKAFILGLVYLIIFALMGFFSSGELNILKKNLVTFSGYCSIFIVAIFMLSFYTTYLQVIISFGNRRKAYLISKNIITIIIMMGLIVITILLKYLFGVLNFSVVLYTVSTTFIAAGISNIMGLSILKYGMKAYIGGCILGGVIGGLIGSGIMKNAINIIQDFPITVIMVGICIYLGGVFIEIFNIRKYEVK